MLVELAVHDAAVDVHDGDVHALHQQAVGRLEAEQAAADDDGALRGARGREHRVDVVETAEGRDTGQMRRPAPDSAAGSEPVASSSRS